MRTRLRLRHPRDEQGAVAIMTAFLMVGLILCAAAVVDLGNARDVRRQSQNAADAASLAGANVLYPATGFCKPPPGGGAPVAAPCITDAVAEVKLYADKNFQVKDLDWNEYCQASTAQALANVASSGTNCISFNSGSTLVRVYIPTRVAPTFFGGLARSSSILVSSSGQAVVRQAVKCSLCVLGDVDAGNGDFNVYGGSIAVDGKVTAGPNSIWNAQGIGIVGTYSGDHYTPAVQTIPSFDDPLAGLTFPSTTGLSAKTDPCSATSTGGPGSYGSFEVPKTTCNLQPGLYVISGAWTMKNKSLLTGTGVTLYVRSPSGYLDFKNGDAVFSAPTAAQATASGGLAGYAILYDRDNGNTLGLQGNGSTLITGAVYAKASTLDGNGNSCFGFSRGPIVVNGVYSNGNPGCLNIFNAVDTTVLPTLLHLNQ
jgi:Flp pilus assembly protein TadG